MRKERGRERKREKERERERKREKEREMEERGRRGPSLEGWEEREGVSISAEWKGSSNFFYIYRDYTAFCVIPHAIQFRKRMGDTQIYEYLHKLAVDGGKLLSSLWGTEV